MAEGARLESVFTGNRNVGSNPTPSAITDGAGTGSICPITYRGMSAYARFGEHAPNGRYEPIKLNRLGIKFVAAGSQSFFSRTGKRMRG